MHACPYHGVWSLFLWNSHMHVLIIVKIREFTMFWVECCIWSWFEKLKIKKLHACYVLALFIKVTLKLCSIGILLGFDFIKWSSKHVVLWVSKCFPKNWPKRMSFGMFDSWFELWKHIWKTQILASTLERPPLYSTARSSDEMLARA